MTQNQYLILAKTFFRLYSHYDFPLRISRKALSGPFKRGVKSIALRKFSPLIEPFSVVLLRIYQSGICQHFGIIPSSIDFSVNPNIRTNEQDWSQIITLDIVKIFFPAMFIVYLMAFIMAYFEHLSPRTRFSHCSLRFESGLKRASKLLILIFGLIITFISIALLYGYTKESYNGVKFGKSRGKMTSFNPPTVKYAHLCVSI